MPSSNIRDVSGGFSSSAFEMLLVVLGLLAFVLVILGIFLVQNRKMRERLRLQSARGWQRAVARLRLSPAELALAGRLARLVGDPDTRRHLVLTNQATYNQCATRLLGAGGVTEQELAALRVRLGFSQASTEKRVTTTAILPVGLRLYVVQRETKKFYGTILENKEDGLMIRVDDTAVIAPGPGTELRCYFNVKNGTFHFGTSVKGLDGQVLRIAHSETISRTQRRGYYRARTDLPAFVSVAGSAEQPTPSRLLDISGGGAAAENPGLRFNRGDDVQIIFRTEDDAEYKLIGEVRRLSRGGQVMHMVFGPLGDTTRDRLIAFALRQRDKNR